MVTVTALLLSVVAGTGVAAKAAVAPRPWPGGLAGTSAVPGAQLWAARFSGPGRNSDVASSVAVGPGGARVFVTGSSTGRTGPDYATVAYNAATGARLWSKRYNSPGNGSDSASSVTVSPDGKTVFVTGTAIGATSGQDYLTVAYDASTGAQVWVRRYNGPANASDIATKVAVSPAGGTVFVTGYSTGVSSGYDYATIAYNAATGKRVWLTRYNGPGESSDAAYSLAVSPNGKTLFVTGQGAGTDSFNYVTIGYDTANGAQEWAKSYDRAGAGLVEAASSVTVSPDSGTVFVTGQSGNAYATVAYRAAGGAQLWARRYTGNTFGNAAHSVAVSPSGKTVFVTGQSGDDYATIGYNASTGGEVWVKRYPGVKDSSNVAHSVAVSKNGKTVYVTGTSLGITSADASATIAYDAATGAKLWSDFYLGPARGGDRSFALAVNPSNGTVVVTGGGYAGNTAQDYTTEAYAG